MPKHKLCDGYKNEIHSRKECRAASKALGLEFKYNNDTPPGFPRCGYNTALNVVRFSKNPIEPKDHIQIKRDLQNIGQNLASSRRAICITGIQ